MPMVNVDDLLTGTRASQPAVEQKAPEPEVVEAQHVEHDDYNEEDSGESLKDIYAKKEAPEEKAEQETPEAGSEEKQFDEYGNEIGKPRMYSEEEVQKMIRDRLARGRAAQEPVQPTRPQENLGDFKFDPESNEPWEVQLEKFVQHTVKKEQIVQQKLHEQELVRQQQAKFEEKFNNGMSKYKDFVDVVNGKPITNAMMLASREMQDPAAFFYAAAKLHPQELDRISKINDSFAQALEIGRLEERIKKQSARVTKMSAPIKKVSGDVAQKHTPRLSIDDRIREYSKRKYN